MIGDVNLFFKGAPDEEDFEVEVEIMIAGTYVPTICDGSYNVFFETAYCFFRSSFYCY